MAKGVKMSTRKGNTIKIDDVLAVGHVESLLLMASRGNREALMLLGSLMESVVNAKKNDPDKITLQKEVTNLTEGYGKFVLDNFNKKDDIEIFNLKRMFGYMLDGKQTKFSNYFE